MQREFTELFEMFFLFECLRIFRYFYCKFSFAKRVQCQLNFDVDKIEVSIKDIACLSPAVAVAAATS